MFGFLSHIFAENGSELKTFKRKRKKNQDEAEES